MATTPKGEKECTNDSTYQNMDISRNIQHKQKNIKENWSPLPFFILPWIQQTNSGQEPWNGKGAIPVC